MSFLYNRKHLMGKRKCTILLIASILILQGVHIVPSEASPQEDGLFGIGDSDHRVLHRRRQTTTTTRSPIPNDTEDQNLLDGILNIFNPFNFNKPHTKVIKRTRAPGSTTTPGNSAALGQTPAPGQTAALGNNLDSSQTPAPDQTTPPGQNAASGQTVAPGHIAAPAQTAGLGKTAASDRTAAPEHSATSGQTIATVHSAASKQTVAPVHTAAPGQTAGLGKTAAPGQTAGLGKTAAPGQTAGLGKTAAPGQTASPGHTGASGQNGAPGQTAKPGQNSTTDPTSGLNKTAALAQTASPGHTAASVQTVTPGQTSQTGQTIGLGKIEAPSQTPTPYQTAGLANQSAALGQTASLNPTAGSVQTVPPRQTADSDQSAALGETVTPGQSVATTKTKLRIRTTKKPESSNWLDGIFNPFGIFNPQSETISTPVSITGTKQEGLVAGISTSADIPIQSKDSATTSRATTTKSSNWLDGIFNPFGIFNPQSEAISTPASITGSKQGGLVAGISTSADIPIQSKDSATTSRTTTKSSNLLDAINPFNMFNPQIQTTPPVTTLDPSLPPGGRGFSGLAYNINLVIENVVDLLADLLLINDDWEPGYEQKRVEALTVASKAIVDILLQSDQPGGLGSIWDKLLQIWHDLNELFNTFTSVNPGNMLGLPVIGMNIMNDLGKVASFFSLKFPTTTPTPGKKHIKKLEIDHSEFEHIIQHTERLVENLLHIEETVEKQFPDGIILPTLGNFRKAFEKSLEESKKTGHPIVLGTIKNLFPNSFIAQIIAEMGKALGDIDFAPVQIIGAILQQQLPINLGLSAIQIFVSPMLEGIERVIGQFIDDISSRLLKLDPNHAILNIIKTTVDRTGSFGKYLADFQNITSKIQLNFTEGDLLWQVFNHTFHLIVASDTMDFMGETVEQIIKLIPLDYLSVLPQVIASLTSDVITLSTRFMYRFIMTLGYIFFPSITTPAPDIGNATSIP